MKKRTQRWVVLFACLFTFSSYAQNVKTFKFWTSTPGACPIKVTVNGVPYHLYQGSSTFTLNLKGSPTIKAYDKYGDVMHVTREAVYDGSRTHLQYVSVNVGANHWQHISKTKSSGSPEGNDASSVKSSAVESPANNSGETDESLESTIANVSGQVAGSAVNALTNVTEGLSHIESDGYPNFQIRAGVSRAYGEFIGLKWCAGREAGFTMYGGIGKDWLFDGDNNNKVSWHAGLGGYISIEGDADDITFGLTYSESAIVRETLMIDVTYSCFFGNSHRIGFFVGGGVGCGNIGHLKVDENDKITNKQEAKFVWDLNIGIAFKLWTNRIYKH